MDALKVAEANMVVHVHPSKSSRVSDAILRELSSLLFKFSEIFDGVVLAYDPEIRSNLAKILPGIHPYFGVKLRAKLLLFHPKPDMLLEGEVVKISPQSIHVIVLGFSSAVIMEEDIREEFRYKFRHGKEVFVSKSHKKHKIQVGTILRFLVKSFDDEILHISGLLGPAHTGCVRWLERNPSEWSQADSTVKKRGIEAREVMVEHDKLMVNQENSLLNPDTPVKKSKKRKSGET